MWCSAGRVRFSYTAWRRIAVRVIVDVPLDLRPRVSYGNSRLDLTVADTEAASACSMS